ncbi:MAG: hypothetical protein Q7T03_03650 [Deltaproteobacteria bacterium]|nr:hypothetical protein [Deltaproteobacteria bacterium]
MKTNAHDLYSLAVQYRNDVEQRIDQLRLCHEDMGDFLNCGGDCDLMDQINHWKATLEEIKFVLAANSKGEK